MYSGVTSATVVVVVTRRMYSKRREDHSGFDRHRQIREDRQHEGDAPDRGFGRTQLDDLGDLAPLAHVVRAR